MMKDGENTLADLKSALPKAERMDREKRIKYKQMLEASEAASEERRKEKLEMAKKGREAKKSSKKAAEGLADVIIEGIADAVVAAAPVLVSTDKKETYQDSILAIMNGTDMPYATIMKATIDRRVDANLMTRPRGPNGACGAALKKMVQAGVLTMPTRGVYAVAKA